MAAVLATWRFVGSDRCCVALHRRGDKIWRKEGGRRKKEREETLTLADLPVYPAKVRKSKREKRTAVGRRGAEEDKVDKKEERRKKKEERKVYISHSSISKRHTG